MTHLGLKLAAIWDDLEVDPEMLVTVCLILRIKHDHSENHALFGI